MRSRDPRYPPRRRCLVSGAALLGATKIGLLGARVFRGASAEQVGVTLGGGLCTGLIGGQLVSEAMAGLANPIVGVIGEFCVFFGWFQVAKWGFSECLIFSWRVVRDV